MARSQKLTETEVKSVLRADNDVAVIEQEKLSSPVTNYIKLLLQQYPSYHQEVKVDRIKAAAGLEHRFPVVKGHEAEMHEVIGLIGERIKSLPVTSPTTDIVLNIYVNSSKSNQSIVTEPDEPAVVAWFGAAEGVLRSRMLQANEKAGGLNDMNEAGLIIVGQAMTPAVGPSLEEKPYLYGSKERPYGERSQDVTLTGDDSAEPAFTDRLPLRELRGAALLGGIVGGDFTDQRQVMEGEAAILAMRAFNARNMGMNYSEDIEANTVAAVSDAEAAAVTAARLQRERRDEPHDRRGPGRPDYYRPGDTFTDEGKPLVRYEGAALLGRETVAAENEITAAPTTTRDGFSLTPHRPDGTIEESLAQTNAAVVGGPPANASPFAPPATAIATAIETERALQAAATPANITQPQAVPAQGTPGSVFVERRREARVAPGVVTEEGATALATANLVAAPGQIIETPNQVVETSTGEIVTAATGAPIANIDAQVPAGTPTATGPTREGAEVVNGAPPAQTTRQGALVEGGPAQVGLTAPQSSTQTTLGPNADINPNVEREYARDAQRSEDLRNEALSTAEQARANVSPQGGPGIFEPRAMERFEREQQRHNLADANGMISPPAHTYDALNQTTGVAAGVGVTAYNTHGHTEVKQDEQINRDRSTESLGHTPEVSRQTVESKFQKQDSNPALKEAEEGGLGEEVIRHEITEKAVEGAERTRQPEVAPSNTVAEPQVTVSEFLAAEDAAPKNKNALDYVRSAISSMSDATLVALAALGSPTAKAAYQRRIEQSQEIEASEEDREDLREAMHDERVREQKAEADHQGKKSSQTPTVPHHPLEELTPD